MAPIVGLGLAALISFVTLAADDLERVLPIAGAPRLLRCSRTPAGLPDCVPVTVAPSVRVLDGGTLLASADPRAGAWVQGIPIDAASYNADEAIRPLCPDLPAVCTGIVPLMPAGFFCLNLDKMTTNLQTKGAAALMYAVYFMSDQPAAPNSAQWFFGFLGDPSAAMQLRAGIPSPFNPAGVVGTPGAFFKWFPQGPGCKGYPGFSIDPAVMIPWTQPTPIVTDAYVFVVLP